MNDTLRLGMSFVWITCAAAVAAPLAPENLRCEYRVNPLGIDEAAPRLSWEVRDPARGAMQAGYHILVAGSLDQLEADAGDVWDSGRVDGDQSIHVAYAGRPLASGRRYYWKVRTWDAAGAGSPWSAPAWWEMGLLAPEDWRAEWIALPGAPEGGESGPAPYFRREFDARAGVERARAYVTARGLYELRLNGERVSDEYFRPGWTDYHRRQPYQVYDVTELVRPGRNAVGLIVGDGWYAGYIAFYGRQLYGRQLMALCQLHIDYADGSSERIVSDGSWKAATGPILSSDFQHGEEYDARLEHAGWDLPGFDDGAWQAVQALPREGAPLVLTAVPPPRRIVELAPRAVTEPAPGTYVFDLGQNMVGWARLRVRGPAGAAVTMRFAEVLNPDGSIYTANLRHARATDRYTLRGGDEEESYEPHFTFHGFRYVELTGYPGVPGAEAVTGVVIASDTEPTGEFVCNDELVNKLQHAIVWGQRGNFLEIPTDCPQRDERLGWTGDIQVFARTAAFNMNVAGFLSKWLVDLMDAQRGDGAFTDFAPSPRGDAGNPAWGDAGVTVPWDLYQLYGDRRILERCYTSMQRWIEFRMRESRDGLAPRKGYGDWLSYGVDTPKDLLTTAYLARSLDLVARAAEVLGKADDAETYRGHRRAVRRAFQEAYVTGSGRLVGDTQTAYLMALAFDLLEPRQRAQAMEHLVADIAERKYRLSTGFVGTPLLLPQLCAGGREDVAFRLLKQDSVPSWGHMIKHGATTIWERWDSYTEDRGFHTPSMNSFNHYAFGAVGEWLYAHVGGIAPDPREPGYKRILIRPRPGGGIQRAQARLRSLYGEIATDWRAADGAFTLELTVPPNTRATVHLPARSLEDAREGGIPLAQADGVTDARHADGEALCVVGGGRYNFTSVLP